MNSVDFSSQNEDIEVRLEKINKVSNQIYTFRKRIARGLFEIEKLQVLIENIYETLKNWTGKNYIGIEKDNRLKKAFQRLFENLTDFLITCKEVPIAELNEFAQQALFQGTLYRYLGHTSLVDFNERIEPCYDGVYVSWSKNPQNNYIEDKLRGTMTLLTCKVSGAYYGIDLSVFEVDKGTEAEVVFPTIESTIVNKEYIERPY